MTDANKRLEDILTGYALDIVETAGNKLAERSAAMRKAEQISSTVDEMLSRSATELHRTAAKMRKAFAPSNASEAA